MGGGGQAHPAGKPERRAREGCLGNQQHSPCPGLEGLAHKVHGQGEARQSRLSASGWLRCFQGERGRVGRGAQRAPRTRMEKVGLTGAPLAERGVEEDTASSQRP